MREELIEYLKSPHTGEDLDLIVAKKAADGHIIEGKLVDMRSGIEYPIVKGVPCFVKSYSCTSQRYSKFFRLWQEGVFRRDLLYGLTEFEELAGFMKKFGIPVEELNGRFVLDAGCGVGRLLKALGKYARCVVGFDIHDGIWRVFEKTRLFKNIHVVKADIYNLPFKCIFDYVWCEGVLSYLKIANLAVENLGNVVKPSGLACVDAYLKGGDIFLHILRLVRSVPHAWELAITLSSLSAKAQLTRVGAVNNIMFSIIDYNTPEEVRHYALGEVLSWFSSSWKVIKLNLGNGSAVIVARRME